jgi:hypothetical protein
MTMPKLRKVVDVRKIETRIGKPMWWVDFLDGQFASTMDEKLGTALLRQWMRS